MFVEDLVDTAADLLGDSPIEFLGDPARHAGERVAVPAQRDRLANRVLEVVRLQEGPDRRRYTLLARDLELVLRADHVQCRVEMIIEGRLDVILDLFLGLPRSGQEDCRGNGLGAL